MTAVRHLPQWRNVRSYGATGDGSTNDTTAFTNAIAAGPGVVRIPYTASGYVVLRVRVPANVTIYCDPGVKFKLPSTGLTAGDYCFFLGAEWGSSTPEENMAILGGPYTFDFSAISAGNTVKGILVGGARLFTIENARGLSIPDGNVVQLSMGGDAGSGSAVPENGLVRNVKATTAPSGYGAVQVTAGKGLDFTGISTDGGVALRLELDGQCADLTGVTARNLRCVGGTAALYLTPHDKVIRGVHVSGLVGVGSTYLVNRSSPGASGGGVYDVTVECGYHSGGTSTVYAESDGVSGAWDAQGNIVWRNIESDSVSGSAFYSPGGTWYDCYAKTPGAYGWRDPGMHTTPAATIRNRWFNCRVYNPGAAYGWSIGYVARSELWSCSAVDDRSGSAVMDYGVLAWHDSAVQVQCFGCTFTPTKTGRVTTANSATCTETNSLS